ncbi:MAG: tetratricopeptide repeat protein [Bdellovibrionales bacterium]|nr:tetratricopeptide repeat protein [Bdellovibrionales bacterium]
MKNVILILSLLAANQVLAASSSEAQKVAQVVVKEAPAVPENSVGTGPGFDYERWKKLMALIDNEIKTIKGNRYSGPELKHRLFELYSEKIKLIKEKENLNLIKADPATFAKNGKESYFKASKAQYKTAQSYAIGLVAQYPKYKRIAEIYYALAINSRDYGTNEETERFLKLSIANSNGETKVMYNAKTALAEYYYNSKRYHEAVDYYADVLKNPEDEWYGKHLYNAGWCHLKERNFKHALELLKLSFETTKNKKYVSMKEQVFSAIGIFFVQADATYEGIEFFEKNAVPSAPQLIGLAISSMNKSQFSMTDDVLKAALKDTKKRKDANGEMKVRLAQLDIYRESKKDEEYFDTANNILVLHKKNALDKDDLFLAQNKIKEVAGFMQINLVKDKTKDPVVYNKEEYKKIMRYFDILSSLDRPNKKLYRYYQGETALSAQDYTIALKYYVRSVMNAKMTKEKDETTKKALDAMLATIEYAKLPKAKEDEYTIFAFKNYVIFYPISEKSQAIYQKLFNKYFELSRIKKAVNLLMVYKFYYPSDDKIHREMLTQILDSYIKEKNTDKLAFWIGKIEKGYLSFTNEYIQNSIAVLGELLFNKYQALEKKGEMKAAVKGYESIYDSKKYPRRTKAEAAYAISALSLEQNKSKESYKWLKKSLDLYEDKDLMKVTSSLFVLVKGYRLLQNFEISQEIALMTARKFCKEAYKNKEDYYQLINENVIIENQGVSALMKVEDEFKKCDLNEKLLSKTQSDNMERLIYADKYKDAFVYFKAHPENPSLLKMMTTYMKFKHDQNPTAMAKDLSEVQDKIDLSASITHRQNVEAFVKKILDMNFVFSEEEKFNEEKFNGELEQYFAMIGELNNQAVTLSKLSGPEEIIMIRNVLGKPYFSLVKAVRSYVPKGVDNNYLDGFKQGMRQITESLLSKGLQVDREKVAYLEKNNYFFEIQKNDIVGLEKGSPLEKALNFHSSLLFSNTLDVGLSNKSRTVAGQQ